MSNEKISKEPGIEIKERKEEMKEFLKLLR